MQQDAIAFALARIAEGKHSYLALDPGLGKTLCAAVISGEFQRGILYVCPPFLVANVAAEFAKWAPKLKVGVYRKTEFVKVDVLIIPDSIVAREGVFDELLHFRRMFWDYKALIVIDEAHRLKNPSAKRTKAVLGGLFPEGALVDLFDSWIFLSGTPMPNSPIEMFSIISKAAPETIDHMNLQQYGQRYCGAYRMKIGRGRYAWKMTGASNVKELGQRVIGSFMLRIKKDKALKLPPKLEELFIISGSLSPRLQGIERDLGQKYSEDDDVLKQLFTRQGNDELHLMTYRKLLGLEKVRHAVQLLENLMEDTKENVLVFAYHTDVIQGLVSALQKYEPFLITGQTKMPDRQRQVDAFQKGQGRLFIGNYIAMGVGFTLTRANRVLFVEFDWVPGVNDQASDRPHRIGQTKSVFVQYMVYQNSLDKRVLEGIIRKRASIKLIE